MGSGHHDLPPGLRREVGLAGAIWSSVTSVIGSGWLFGALFAAQAAGSAALLGWLIAGLAVLVLALVHAELGGMLPMSGGTARFPHVAFGSVAGISFGFFSWLQAATQAPIECFAVMQYGSSYWPGLYDPASGNVTGVGFAVTIVLMAGFTAINFLAMRAFARVNGVITWWKIAVPLVTVVVLLFHFQPGNFTAGGGFLPAGVEGLFAAIPAAGIVFAFTGFEQANQLAGEIRDPAKNLPRAIISAVLICVAVYLLLQLVFIGAIPTHLISGPRGWLGIPADHPVAVGPFAGLAGVLGLGWLAVVLRVDAIVSPFGTGLVYLTATSRLGYGMARNRYYPQVLARTDRRGVPWVSLLLSFAVGLVFLLPFPSWHQLVSLVTGASVLMYAGAPLALGVFRRRLPDRAGGYRMRAGGVLTPLAFVVANLLIYWSGFGVVWKLGVCVLVGYVLIGASMLRDRRRPELDWRSAQWLPVYLLGLGILSWQGRYDGGQVPAANTGNLPFWWDMLAVAAFSLAVYFWAIRVSTSRDRILARIAEQADDDQAAVPPTPPNPGPLRPGTSAPRR